MSLYTQFAVDNKKESDGVKIEMFEAENEDGTVPAFFVSRMGKSNKRYSKALESATRPYRRQIQLGTMNNEKAEEIFLEVFCDTVLMRWENVTGKDGKALPFNKQNAIGLFKDLPEVYERLQEEAQMSANFRDETVEAEAKN